MKSSIITSILAVFVSFSVSAQTQKTETIAVSGNCGMCKNKIEKTALGAGATEADWDADKKQLTVSYAAAKTNATKIQEQIAAVGYDTRDIKGNDEAYNKLHGCCQYDRTMTYEQKEQKASVKADAVKKTEKSCCAGGEEKKAEKSCCSNH